MMVACRFVSAAYAEATWTHAVQITATVTESPAKIALTWPDDDDLTINFTQQFPPLGFTVYRKGPTDSTWTRLQTPPGTAKSFDDTTVSVGTVYEYKKDYTNIGYNDFGYIQTGSKVPPVHQRGNLILIVDNQYSGSMALQDRLTRLQDDLVGDGWTIVRHDVSRTDSVVSVKNTIKADWNADQTNVKAVFLFGHVPVPYSGYIAPDGHEEHRGAWPADVYYADMTGT